MSTPPKAIAADALVSAPSAPRPGGFASDRSGAAAFGASRAPRPGFGGSWYATAGLARFPAGNACARPRPDEPADSDRNTLDRRAIFLRQGGPGSQAAKNGADGDASHMSEPLSILLPWLLLIGVVGFLLLRTSRSRPRRPSRPATRRRQADPPPSRSRRSPRPVPPRQHPGPPPRREGRRLPDRPVPGRVTRVPDGDSLEAQVQGLGRLRMRLAYVDAPELDQPWGREARDALATLVLGATPQFRLLARDRFGRAIAILSVRDVVYNEHLVREGHAWAFYRHMPKRLRGRYRHLENTARTSGAGLWGARERPVPPWKWRHRNTG